MVGMIYQQKEDYMVNYLNILTEEKYISSLNVVLWT